MKGKFEGKVVLQERFQGNLYRGLILIDTKKTILFGALAQELVSRCGSSSAAAPPLLRLFLCCGSLSLFASRAFSSAAALPPPLPTSSASSLRLFLGQSCLISSFNFLFFVSWEDLALQTAIASQRDQIPPALSRIVGTHTLFPPWI